MTVADRQAVNPLDHPWISAVMAFLILFSVACFSVETLPDLEPSTRVWLGQAELVVVVLFSVEYLLRCVFEPKPWRYVLSFYGLIDLIAILPFYLSLGVDARSLRLLRFLRVLRILKLTRYSQATSRFSQALFLVKEELVVFLLFSVMVIYLAAVGIYYFENPAQPELFRSIFDCLWWAVITLTTVGYGDIYPITLGGRLFTFIMLLVGLGLVAVPSGIVASALSAIRREEERQDQEDR